MAEIQITELPINYLCRERGNCASLDPGSCPMCPNDYRECRIFIESNNPKLYKEMFGKK